MRYSRLFVAIVASLLLDSSLSAGEPPRPNRQASSRRPVHTYSIVARDPKTGELGVAVQSHWFGVGAMVPWAEAGVGAIATQSFVDASYGKLGLDLMRAGRSAPEGSHGRTAYSTCGWTTMPIPLPS